MTRRGAAAGFERHRAADAVVRPLLAAAMGHPDCAPATRDDMRAVLANSERVWDHLVAHLHGAAQPGVTPDLISLNAAVGALEQMAVRLSR